MDINCFLFDRNEKIYEIKDINGNEEQISSNFLKQQEGTFIIWVEIEERHCMPAKEKGENTYIISHATNNGDLMKTIISESDEKSDTKTQEPSEISIYPNVWSIGRSSNSKEVIWRFWCNDNIGRRINLKSNMKLEKGMNMFSVIWSREKNFIKFYINDKVVGNSDFKFWPDDFDKHVIIGTWRNKAKGHYFNSKIGNWVILKNAISFNKLTEYFNYSNS